MTATPLFAQSLKSSVDVASINKYFAEGGRDLTVEVLQQVRPEGRPDNGRFKLASFEGGVGSSFDYNLISGEWGDWSNAATPRGKGIVPFLAATLKCTTAQAVKFLTDNKFLDRKDVKRALGDSEGNPLVLPIPEDKASFEYVLEQDVMRRDRGILKGHWQYLDTDGSLLGYKIRVDQRSTTKEVYPLTYRAQTEWTKKGWEKKLVPLYGLQKFSQGPTVRVLFVEGEKTADAAQELLGKRWKVFAFSGVSASHDVWIPHGKFWEDVEVVLWPDNDNAGSEAMRKIQLALERMPHRPREIRIVRVDAIPGLPPKWDLADWEEGCGVDVKVEIERAEEVDSFDRICREWVYVTQQDEFHNLLDRGLIWKPPAWDRRYSRYGDKSGTPSKKFLSAIETIKVDDLDNVPGEGTFLTSASGKVFLNEWYPSEHLREARRIANDSSITDEEIAENAKHFVQHVTRIASNAVAEPERSVVTGEYVPGTEERPISDAFMFYLKNVVERPMDKSGWVPMLVSEKNGTGKSYFLTLMEQIHGGNRTVVVNVQQYIGQYHDWRDGVLFYELGEAKYHENTQVYEEIKKNHNHRPFSYGHNSDRMAGAQKLNIKTRGMKNQRDFLNGMITSNNLFPLVLSGGGDTGGDRRLLVIRCEQILTRQEADDLYGEITLKSPWVAAYLMRYSPACDWNPGWAPVTEHKRAMFEKDRERAETRNDKTELGRFDEFFHFLRHAKADGVGGFARKVITSEVIRDICELRRIKFPYDDGRFNKIAERAGLPKGPDLRVDGQLKRLYAVDPEMVGKPDKEWKEELAKSINDKL